ncbi:MAG: ATP-binding protein [Bacteroidota bacterium]
MEIAIISGKGGTGKSSISAAFATLHDQVILADCDVDAANQYILFDPVHDYEESYQGGMKAVIDYKLCFNCGICQKYCRFDAISRIGNRISITETSCDGCQLCERVCPTAAISMVRSTESRLYSGTFRNGLMVYGRLAPGEENSGKLVSKVRERARKLAAGAGISTIILDGPPGIGCPVLSTVTGTDGVVIVTEPTLSGLHDLRRTIETLKSLKLKTWVIINKYDLSASLTFQIAGYCRENAIPVIAMLPFEPGVVEAMVRCKTISEYLPCSVLTDNLSKAWDEIQKTFNSH